MTRSRLRGRFRPAVEVLEDRRTPSVSVAGQQVFSVGSKPVDAAVADFNGDGRPDLAVVNADSNTVSILRNTTAAQSGAAAFAAQQTFAAGNRPASLVVADFNGDGKPDIAVANYSNDSVVTVLLNTTPAGSATFSFAAPKTFAVGTLPAALAAADFNGDGKPDIAVVNLNDNTVSLLRNTTATGAAVASFAAQQTFATGTNPIFVAAGDFNGDGKADLAIANSKDNTVSVLLNATAAGATTFAFAAQKTFAVGAGPIPVAVADLNGDGKPDLIVTNSKDNTVSVLFNATVAGAATPAFASQKTFAVGGDPQAVAVVDLDGDGKPDLAVSNFADNTVSLLVNTTAAGAATPSFAAQQLVAVGAAPVPVAVGDFNGDGQPDLAVANNVGQTVSLLFNATAPLPAAPVVVGQFGATGVWQYNRAAGSWIQLTGANATLLAADPAGDVVGEFPGHGVWEYTTAAGWRQINGVDATALAMNAGGTAVANFPGFGVGQYLPGAGWWLMTGANASLLALDPAGDVAGVFPGHGLWLFTLVSGWKQVDGIDASALAMTPTGDVVADFPGYALWELKHGGGWVLLNGYDAHALATDAKGNVFAAFTGFGVGEFSAAGWGLLTAADAGRLGGGANGEVFGAFPGNGVWEFFPSWGWFLIRGNDAAPLVVA